MSGLQLRNGLHGGLRLFSLAAHLHILLLVDQQRESLAHEGMIVDDQNGLLGGLRGLVQNEIRRHCAYPFTWLDSIGNMQVTTFPRSGFGLTSSLPPIIPAR